MGTWGIENYTKTLKEKLKIMRWTESCQMFLLMSSWTGSFPFNNCFAKLRVQKQETAKRWLRKEVSARPGWGTHCEQIISHPCLWKFRAGSCALFLGSPLSGTSLGPSGYQAVFADFRISGQKLQQIPTVTLRNIYVMLLVCFFGF